MDKTVSLPKKQSFDLPEKAGQPSQDISILMAAVCTNCGFHNPPGMRFCGNCGMRIPDAARSEPPSQPFRTKTKTAPLDPAALGVMTGADLLQRFRQAGLEATGQRRSVTVLFVDLSSYTLLSEELGDEELFEMVQKFIHLLVNAVYQYEGMVDKLTGDGLMALFGAPIAHENNAERALRSAMDMISGVARLSKELDLGGRELKIHIGLNAGSVIVGGLGGDGLMNYTAIGDVVNLSRRLEEAAGPGEILASEGVYRQTSRLFDFEKLPPLTLKNISKEVNAFKFIGPKARPGAVRGLEGLRAPMIGREFEMHQVMGMLEHLSAERQGGLVFLVGEGGMGKSRLTSEIKSRLDYSKLRVLEGHSLTYRKAVPYWIFQDLLRGYLGVPADAPEEEVRRWLSETVQSRLGENAAEKLPYLEHMLALEPSDLKAAENIRFLDPVQLRQQVYLAVRDLLVAEANHRPLLLILEDLHWADDSSLGLIRFLIDSIRGAPLLLYAISRPFEGGAVQAIHDRAGQRLGDRYLFLRLQALEPDQSNQLIEALLAIPDLPKTLREQIIQRSAGLPFYLEEILRMLIENNVLTLDTAAGRWKITPGADINKVGVPETLQGLILTRFDRLEPVQRRLLQTASVIGYEFSAQVLCQVLSGLVKEEELKSALDLLAEHEFILRQANLEDAYQFKHVLVSDAVYSTLLQRDRRELHTRVGQTIEKVFADRLDTQIEVLAGHFLRSPLQDRALHYLTIAGQKAARSYANDQARILFSQALEVLPKAKPTPEQATAIYLGLGDAMLTAGEYQPAREQFLSALKELGEPTGTGVLRPLDEVLADDNRLVEERVRTLSLLQRKIGTTHERQGDYDRALACLRSAQSLIEFRKSTFVGERASIMNDIGFIDFRRGNLDRAEALLREAFALAESIHQYDLVGSILNRLAGIYFQRDQVEPATRYLKRSLELREKIGDVVAVARSYNNLGLLNWKQGDLNKALEYFDQCYKLQSNLGDVEGMIVLHTNMGLIELDRGRLLEAEHHFQQALASAGEIGHTYYVCLSRMNLALMGVYTGDWQQVLEQGKLSLAGFEELSVQEHLLDLYWVMAWGYRGSGDPVRLEEAVQKIRDLLAQEAAARPAGKTLRPSEGEGRSLRLFARVARDRGETEPAREMLKKSIDIFTSLGSQMERSRSIMDLASLMAACGEKAESKALLAEARDIFQKMGARLDLERVRAIEELL